MTSPLYYNLKYCCFVHSILVCCFTGCSTGQIQSCQRHNVLLKEEMRRNFNEVWVQFARVWGRVQFSGGCVSLSLNDFEFFPSLKQWTILRRPCTIYQTIYWKNVITCTVNILILLLVLKNTGVSAAVHIVRETKYIRMLMDLIIVPMCWERICVQMVSTVPHVERFFSSPKTIQNHWKRTQCTRKINTWKKENYKQMFDDIESSGRSEWYSCESICKEKYN